MTTAIDSATYDQMLKDILDLRQHLLVLVVNIKDTDNEPETFPGLRSAEILIKRCAHYLDTKP